MNPRKSLKALAISTVLGLAVCYFLLRGGSAQAQETEKGSSTFQLPPLIVTATRTEQSWLEVPYAVEVKDSQRITYEYQSRTVPEALKEIPGVMVQKTAHGQGSPYIRGFTGYRTLMLIDGIRLNNSCFRDGPNQYWSTVDPFDITQMELVKGPASVLYGSDAIGGTLNVLTKRIDVFGEETKQAGNLVYRYSNAEDSYIGRAEGGLRLSSALGLSGGFTYKDFGDVRAAGLGTEHHTGYDDLGGDISLEYRIQENRRLDFAYQHVEQDDIWRTHRTIFAESWRGTSVGTDRKYATDQKRRLAYAQYHDKTKIGFVDSIDLSLSLHMQDEDRTRIRSDYKQELEGFDCDTIGFTGQFLSNGGTLGTFTYGFEYYRDYVDSYLHKYSATGRLQSKEIQGPVADDARYDLAGLYLQDEIFFGDNASIIAGGRYTYARADADKVKDPVTGAPMALTKSWHNGVGNLRGQYFLIPELWGIYGGVSQGFRAPDFSDLTSFQAAFQDSIETPSTSLKPEKYLNYEIGIKGQTENATVQAAYFYTDMEDVIVRYPTGALIDGDRELKKANAAKGYVHGCELFLNYKINPEIQGYGMLTWLDGRIDQPQLNATGDIVIKKDYISKLQPLTVILGLRYDHPSKRYWAEGLVTLVNQQNHLAYSDHEDSGRIPPGGNPGYTLVTLRSGFKLGTQLQAALAMENLFNEEYRVLGSGQNEPGRNFIATLSWKF